ncbi:sensor domain-containing protein [Paenibacillus agricola]|uniref:EAL domain-containing protein n=1 Tax=Paenibacillus agricola TaxID=2716264 RepID=A0ABX0IYW5_9BACL|nr:EAL domain-containing protein [Paenibacillus agricola]NHN29072.1 EAL domain-containing protein [Paenibacillus agricola]
MNVVELPFYRNMFQTLIDNAPVGIYVIEDGAFSYVNTKYSHLFGYERQDFALGLISIEKIVHPDDFAIVQNNMKKRLLGDKEEAHYKIRSFHKNGSLIYTEMHTTAMEISGKIIVFGSVIDSTEQVLAQQQLQESKERYKSLFDNSPNAIFSFDDLGKFLCVNASSEQITGYSEDELLNMHFTPLIISEDIPQATKNFIDAKKGISSNSDLAITRKDGKKIHLNVIQFPMKVNGEIVGSYGVARDITQKIEYDQQMEQFAFYDPLTKLPNRKLFEDRLGQVINFSKEGRNHFAVLFIDLDRFKFINDSFGHQLGDEFLKLVSERLQLSLRKVDTLSRLGGDEFTILLPDISEEEVIRFAEHVNHMLTEPFQLEGHSVTISASIGIALGKGKENGAQELIRHADIAMYHSKKNKKNTYAIYSKEMDITTTYNLTIERDLKFAIPNKELELYYQPIVDLKNGQLKAMEALIRWHHPELGLIPPSDFIPIAEESGQIIKIGAWVLQTACSQWKQWEAAGIPPFKLAVNISTKQLQCDSFVDSVIHILVETGFQPTWLELEVTESILLDDVVVIKESLMRLKQLGISISIDDFGTGYTSLSYLRQYPFDKVKIDRSFIDDISRDMNGKRIASAIISLAHNLNMSVVAEGIEHDMEFQYLMEENCDEGQGYFFSRPLPPHLLQLFLHQQ